MSWIRWAATFAMGAALAACGGGGDDLRPGTPGSLPPPAQAQPAPQLQKPSRSARPLAAAPVLSVSALMNWAEATYPTLFPHGDDFVYWYEPYQYRHYPSTGNYIGVAGTSAYILGPVSHGQLRYVGEVQDYYCLVYPQWCSPSVTANPGAALTASAGTFVRLDGSASTDSSGAALSYSWAIVAKPYGSTAFLQGSGSASPQVYVDVPGTYTLRLTVTSANGSDSGDVQLSATGLLLTTGGMADSPPWGSFASFTLPAAVVTPGSTLSFDTMTLTAIGGSFTIENMNVLDRNGWGTPFFHGLANDQVIAVGQPVTFSVRSSLVIGKTHDLFYYFKVKETGTVFTYGRTITVQ